MLTKAYAKINLGLNIVKKREDGYHEIETIMLPIELHDSIEVSIINRIDDTVVCDNYKAGISKYNLCHKMIEAARKKWKFTDRFDVFIHKNIFLQAGLGGGSSDASAVLKAVLEIEGIKATQEELYEFTKSIGSDIPFMTYGKPAFVSGIGEKVEPISVSKNFLNYEILVVKPVEGTSTELVYKTYDEVEPKINCDVNEILKEIQKEQPILNNLIINSLEPAATKLRPEIIDIEKDLNERGFDYVFMTGGGSCVVGLTKSKHLLNKTLKYYWKSNNFEAEKSRFKQ